MSMEAFNRTSARVAEVEKAQAETSNEEELAELAAERNSLEARQGELINQAHEEALQENAAREQAAQELAPTSDQNTEPPPVEEAMEPVSTAEAKGEAMTMAAERDAVDQAEAKAEAERVAAEEAEQKKKEEDLRVQQQEEAEEAARVQAAAVMERLNMQQPTAEGPAPTWPEQEALEHAEREEKARESVAVAATNAESPAITTGAEHKSEAPTNAERATGNREQSPRAKLLQELNGLSKKEKKELAAVNAGRINQQSFDQMNEAQLKTVAAVLEDRRAGRAAAVGAAGSIATVGTGIAGVLTVAGGSAALGGAVLLATLPVGAAAALGYGGYKLFNRFRNRRMQKRLAGLSARS